MKNIIRSFILFSVALLGLNSCGETDPIIYDGPVFVSFTYGTSGTYFVKPNNEPFPVFVGVPTPSAEDVTIDIDVVAATGEAGTQFDLPSRVTVRAGEVNAAIPVKGYFDRLAGRVDTVTFQLIGEEVANFDTAYTVILQQFCGFDINNFLGTYSCDEAGYEVYEVTFTIDSVNANSILNDNFLDFAAPGQVLRYVFSGGFDQVVIVPEQEFIFGDGTIGSVLGQGTYNGCSGAMEVNYLVNYADGSYSINHIFTPGATAKK